MIPRHTVLSKSHTTHLDLVHVADRVVELHWSPFFHVRLLRRVSVHVALRSCWRRSERCPWDRRVRRRRPAMGSWHRSWLVRTAAAFERSGLARTGTWQSARGAAGGDTKVRLWALYAVLDLLGRLLLPTTRALAAKWLPRAAGGLRRFRQSIAPTADGVDSRSGRRRHSDTVRVVLETAFNTVTGREEGVEALDEVGMASK